MGGRAGKREELPRLIVLIKIKHTINDKYQEVKPAPITSVEPP